MAFTDFPADGTDALLDELLHAPVSPALANVEYKAVQDFGAMPGMHNFRMELDPVHLPFLVGHGGHRAGMRFGQHAESGRHLKHLVAMTHPDVEVRRKAMEERVRIGYGDPGVA